MTGDAALVFVRPEEDGRVTLTDLGHTCMRLSYTRRLTEKTDAVLRALAERHGFTLKQGEIASNDAARRDPRRKNRWLAILRDINDLHDNTRKRLLQSYVAQIPVYEEQRGVLGATLTSLADLQ
jgi:hypothetical protein